MDLATLIPLVLKASIILTVFALGLQATWGDAMYLFRRPGELARSLLAMNVIMPILAVVLPLAFHLTPAVEIALLTLAVSPIPPLLPKKAFKAGGRATYTIGLLTAVALLSIVTVPLAVEVVGRGLGVETSMDPIAVAKIVLMSVLVPLVAGIVVRQLAQGLADSLAKPIALVATIGLLAGAVCLLIAAWPALGSLIGNGTLATMAVFVVIGLASGHFLGGPDPDDRTTLAIATAQRHPGVAMAVAQANATASNYKLVGGAILLYLIVNAIVSIPYVNWRKKQRTLTPSTTA